MQTKEPLQEPAELLPAQETSDLRQRFPEQVSFLAGGQENDVYDYWQIKPRVLLVFAMAFAFGTALTVYQLELVFKALVLLLFVALSIFNLSWRRITLLSLFYLAGSVNAELRTPVPGQEDICRQGGKYCFVIAQVLSLSYEDSGSPYRLLLQCRYLGAKSRFGKHAKESFYTRASSHGKRQELSKVDGCLELRIIGAGKKQASLRARDSARASERSKKKPQSGNSADSLSFLEPGAIVAIEGKLEALKFSKKWRSPRVCALIREKVFCRTRVFAAKIRILSLAEQRAFAIKSGSGKIEEAALFWRKKIPAFHKEVLGEDNGSLLASMVLGDRAVNLGRSMQESFRASGLSHVLAASGFNLSIVAAAIYFCCRFLVPNLWICNLVCFLGMLVFVFVAGPSPSVLRAFLMGALVLLSRCLSRTLHLPAALAFSMFLLLLFDPFAVADIGFQLSFLSTAGLLLGAGTLSESFERSLKFLPRCLRQAAFACILAQLAILPVQLSYFGEFSPYCLLANVLVAPLLPFATVLGFAASFCYALELVSGNAPFVSYWLDQAAFFPVQILSSSAIFVAGLPAALIKVGRACLPAVFLQYFLLLLLPVFEIRGRMKGFLLLYLLSLALLLLTLA